MTSYRTATEASKLFEELAFKKHTFFPRELDWYDVKDGILRKILASRDYRDKVSLRYFNVFLSIFASSEYFTDDVESVETKDNILDAYDEWYCDLHQPLYCRGCEGDNSFYQFTAPSPFYMNGMDSDDDEFEPFESCSCVRNKCFEHVIYNVTFNGVNHEVSIEEGFDEPYLCMCVYNKTVKPERSEVFADKLFNDKTLPKLVIQDKELEKLSLVFYQNKFFLVRLNLEENGNGYFNIYTPEHLSRDTAFAIAVASETKANLNLTERQISDRVTRKFNRFFR